MSWDWLDDVAGYADDVVDFFKPASDFYEENKGWIDPAVDFGVGAYKDYKQGERTGEANARYIASQKPIQDLYDQYLPRINAYYDPATEQKGITKEFNRRKGMLSDVWASQDRPGYAKAYNRGTLQSSPFDRQKATVDTARNKYLLNEALPQAERAYYAQPERLTKQLNSTVGLMRGTPQTNDKGVTVYAGGQPNMSQPYQRALDDPWDIYTDKLLSRL